MSRGLLVMQGTFYIAPNVAVVCIASLFTMMVYTTLPVCADHNQEVVLWRFVFYFLRRPFTVQPTSFEHARIFVLMCLFFESSRHQFCFRLLGSSGSTCCHSFTSFHQAFTHKDRSINVENTIARR